MTERQKNAGLTPAIESSADSLLIRARERIVESTGQSKLKAQLARQAVLVVAEANDASPNELLELIMDYRDVTPKQLPLMIGKGRGRRYVGRMTPAERSRIASTIKPYDKKTIHGYFDQLDIGIPVVVRQGSEYGVIAEPPKIVVQDGLLALDAVVRLILRGLESQISTGGVSHDIPFENSTEIKIEDLDKTNMIAIGQTSIHTLATTRFNGTHGIPVGNPLYRDNLEALQSIHHAISALTDQQVLEPIGLEPLIQQIQSGEQHREYQHYIDGQRTHSDNSLMRTIYSPLA